MEKKRILKAVAYKAVWFYLLILVVLLILQVYFEVFNYNVSVSPLIYWLILLGWVGYVWKNRLDSLFSLAIALVLYMIASIFVIFGLQSVGEILMRLSLIGCIIGLAEALFTARKQ